MTQQLLCQPGPKSTPYFCKNRSVPLRMFTKLKIKPESRRPVLLLGPEGGGVAGEDSAGARQGLIVMHLEMTVHFERAANNLTREVVGAAPTAAEGYISLRGVNLRGHGAIAR